MPDFIVEIHSKSTFGPFSYANPGALKADLTNGKLDLSRMTIEVDRPLRISVKEVK